MRTNTTRDRTTTGPLPLTDRQADVLAEIQRYHAFVGDPCTSAHIARRLKMHHETAREYFAALYRKGWLVSKTSPATPSPRFLARR